MARLVVVNVTIGVSRAGMLGELGQGWIVSPFFEGALPLGGRPYRARQRRMSK